MRLLRLSLILAVALAIPFLIWGESFARAFTGDAAIQWVRAFGAWGWLAIICLLISDLFLPIPATGVMAAAGFLYGPWIGGALSATGSFLAGMLGYWLCRAFGRRAALRLAGEAELARAEALFRHRGPWLVTLSRWLPLLPEVITCLAGLARMPLRTFMISLACGCLPMGFAYAAIGGLGQDSPTLAIVLSLAVPPLLWTIVRLALREQDSP